MNLYLLSLGCARNLVDSEIMLGRVKRAGWAIVDEPEEADVIVVNKGPVRLEPASGRYCAEADLNEFFQKVDEYIA